MTECLQHVICDSCNECHNCGDADPHTAVDSNVCSTCGLTIDICAGHETEDEVLDTLVSQASQPTLATLFKQALKTGALQPAVLYN